jgi:hypothetical protein
MQEHTDLRHSWRLLIHKVTSTLASIGKYATAAWQRLVPSSDRNTQAKRLEHTRNAASWWHTLDAGWRA